MDVEEFRERGKEMIDWICDHVQSLGDKNVLSQVEPGYLRPLIPADAPQEPEEWSEVMKDIERVIMPGMTHWQSPHFHAYFPANSSFESMLGDMLSGALGCVGFSWICSPACTELETVMMDWLGRAMGLPRSMLYNPDGSTDHDAQVKSKGGGVIQGTASEAVLVCMLAARTKACQRIHAETHEDTAVIMTRLIAYFSCQTHSSVEKAAMIAGVKYRALKSKVGTNDIDGEILAKAIEEDKAKGLVPFFVCATHGTTSTCAFDDAHSMKPVCDAHDLWLHIDAAYAGAALICPEQRYRFKGLEGADSFNFNLHKWFPVHFDCSALWVTQRNDLIRAFTVNPEYLKNHASDAGQVLDFRHMQIPLGRRFRSLKIWFTLRGWGISRLQSLFRRDIEWAEYFAEKVRSDERFVMRSCNIGLVCFHLKAGNEASEALLEALSATARFFLVHTIVDGVYLLRFVPGSRLTTLLAIDACWNALVDCATTVLSS